MEARLNDYLGKIEKSLKPMPASERMDIVKEIQCEMLELEQSGKTAEEILTRLGDPKALARAYLGQSIGKSSGFSLKKLCSVAAFYSLAGTAWMFVLPITSCVGISFMVCGVLSPIAGAVRFIAWCLGVDIPQIGIQIGAYSASAVTVLPLSIVIGAAAFLIGKLSWDFTLFLIRKISKAKAEI